MKYPTNSVVQSRLLTLAMISALPALSLFGCKDSSAPSGESPSQDTAQTLDGASAAADEGWDVYHGVLGELTSLPIANDPSSELMIHHTQIPEFKSADGTVHVNSKGISGMPAMNMPYPLAQGISIDGLAIGDKVKFDFQVNWAKSGGVVFEITKIEKIDLETEINFANIKEAAEDAAEDATKHAAEGGTEGLGNKGP